MPETMDKAENIEKPEKIDKSEKLEKSEKIEKTGPFRTFGKRGETALRPSSERAAILDRDPENIRPVLQQIAVIAFIGPSGTGKSSRAIAVARQNHIQYMIDDGLLIHGSQMAHLIQSRRRPLTARGFTAVHTSPSAPPGQAQPHHRRPTSSEARNMSAKEMALPVTIPSEPPCKISAGEK